MQPKPCLNVRNVDCFVLSLFLEWGIFMLILEFASGVRPRNMYVKNCSARRWVNEPTYFSLRNASLLDGRFRCVVGGCPFGPSFIFRQSPQEVVCFPVKGGARVFQISKWRVPFRMTRYGLSLLDSSCLCWQHVWCSTAARGLDATASSAFGY